MESIESPATGEQVELRLDLPGATPLTVNAQVVYSSPPMGFGVRFVRLSAETLGALERGITRLTS